jgi:hypothetical protein
MSTGVSRDPFWTLSSTGHVPRVVSKRPSPSLSSESMSGRA